MNKTQNSLKEVQKKFFWEIWKKDLTNTKKCDIINKSLNNRWQNEILGCRQVVRQRTLTPLFRGFKSFHPNQMKTRCNASGFLFFKYRTGMLILVHVKLEYEKGKSCLLNICGHDFLFFNNQIDSVSLLEFVEKSNLKGSYFLRTRSLGWSMFKTFDIGEIIPVIFRGNGFQGNLQHKNKKKAYPQICTADTLFD